MTIKPYQSPLSNGKGKAATETGGGLLVVQVGDKISNGNSLVTVQNIDIKYLTAPTDTTGIKNRS